MRTILLFLLCLSLLGCTSQLVYKPAPEQVISLADSLQVTGTVQPWALDFTAIAHREADHMRLVVLSAIGIKLLDVTVFPNRAEVYFKQEKFPAVAAQAFIRFTRASLLINCPQQDIFYQDSRTHADFTAKVQGGPVCPLNKQ